MKRLFIILTFIAVTTSLSFAQDIVGDWNGKLTVGTAELRLVLHITKGADGSLRLRSTALIRVRRGFR